jgi:hypothetical protein
MTSKAAYMTKALLVFSVGPIAMLILLSATVTGGRVSLFGVVVVGGAILWFAFRLSQGFDQEQSRRANATFRESKTLGEARED